MKLTPKLSRVFLGYSIESRTGENVKILGIRFEARRVRLYRKKGIHDVLLVSIWDQPITLCVVLTESLRKNLQQFFSDAKNKPEAQLFLPLHHQPFHMKLGFRVHHKNHTRRVVISQGIQKKYYNFSDSEIDLANTYFEKQVYSRP